MIIHDEAWPDSLKDQAVINLLKEYIRLSNAANPAHPDDPSEENFAALFTRDGVYELGSKSAKGHDDIVNMLKGLFAHIPNRDHRILQIYTAGSNQYDLMGYGKVSYKHHHGHETGTDWAGKYILEKVGNEVKFKHLQVIIDTAAHV